jgi:hypothetical protein
VLGGGLGRRHADEAGIAADDGRDARLVVFLDLGDRDVDLGLCVGEQRLDLGAAERLDAALGVDVLDRHQRAGAALRAGIGDAAGHRMDDADFDRLGLGPQEVRRAERSDGGGAGAGEHTAAGNDRKLA